jgi:hypothetical protein
MREQQGVLKQHADLAVVSRHEHPCRGIGEHPVAKAYRCGFCPHQARNHMQRC